MRSHNLSSRDITPHWQSDFVPAEGQAREEYASQHCTEEAHWHGPKGTCDGLCHELNCGEAADFFVHWKAEDGRERCVPFCKWHTHFTADLVGAAVLNALQFGVTDDLRFWREEDTLPDGRRRCDRIYRAIDEWGDSEKARCTRPASKQVRVTRFVDGPYEVQLCDACAKTDGELENAQRSPIPAAVPAPEQPGS